MLLSSSKRPTVSASVTPRFLGGFCHRSFSSPRFRLISAMLDEDDEERVDENALQQLTEMGFPESRAVKALRLNQ